MFKCYVCDIVFHDALLNEHHVIPQAAGGSDEQSNKYNLCTGCHQSLHMVSFALMNPKKSGSTNDILMSLFPDSPSKRQKVFELARFVAKAFIEKKESKKPKDEFSEDQIIISLPYKYKKLLQLAAGENINPKTNRPLGLSSYLKIILCEHLKKKFPLLKAEITKKLSD